MRRSRSFYRGFILRTICLCAIHLAPNPQEEETQMSVNVLYKTSAKATGGRDGEAATLDGALSVKLATPKELGGGGGAGNNPEQLFAAGYAACFIGAMKFVASQGGPKVPADTAVTSTVGIGPRSEGGFGLTVELAVSLPGVPHAEAEALVAKAHQVCPYSNATRGNIDVKLSVA
jgi:osmotically inducible protein OsmC